VKASKKLLFMDDGSNQSNEENIVNINESIEKLDKQLGSKLEINSTSSQNVLIPKRNQI